MKTMDQSVWTSVVEKIYFIRSPVVKAHVSVKLCHPTLHLSHEIEYWLKSHLHQLYVSRPWMRKGPWSDLPRPLDPSTEQKQLLIVTLELLFMVKDSVSKE